VLPFDLPLYVYRSATRRWIPAFYLRLRLDYPFLPLRLLPRSYVPPRYVVLLFIVLHFIYYIFIFCHSTILFHYHRCYGYTFDSILRSFVISVFAMIPFGYGISIAAIHITIPPDTIPFITITIALPLFTCLPF